MSTLELILTNIGSIFAAVLDAIDLLVFALGYTNHFDLEFMKASEKQSTIYTAGALLNATSKKILEVVIGLVYIYQSYRKNKSRPNTFYCSLCIFAPSLHVDSRS